LLVAEGERFVTRAEAITLSAFCMITSRSTIRLLSTMTNFYRFAKALAIVMVKRWLIIVLVLTIRC
jgi:hypothetical protein